MIRVGVVVLFAVLQPLSSLLANLLPGEQASTGDVSDRYVHLLTPAGYAFAIWGLIYLASLGLAGYQALPAQHTRTVHRATGWWIAGAFAASTAGCRSSSAGHWDSPGGHHRAGRAARSRSGTTHAAGPAPSAGERWLLRMPVSAYLGWATIATVAGTGTTARWAGVELAAGVATVAAVVALLVLAVLAAWIGSRCCRRRVRRVAGLGAHRGCRGYLGVRSRGHCRPRSGGRHATVGIRAARAQDPTAVLFG